MTIPVEPHLRAKIEQVAAQYERIAADLRRVVAEGYPEPTDDMPLMDNYVFATRDALCLKGTTVGHASLSATESTTSSALVLVQLLAGVARTESRWYRLGQRLEQDGLPAIVLGLDRGA